MKSLPEIIEREYQLLREMLEIAEEQKNALVKYDIKLVEKTSSKLLEISKELNTLENERINFLVNEIKLSRKQAYSIKLSEIIEIVEFPKITLQKKDEMRQTIEKLASINSMNRLLSNRALSSLNEILSSLSNSNNSVCNVRI